MGLIRIKNQRWFRLLKLLSGIFSLEFTDNKTRGRYGGAAAFFTQEQAKEIATMAGYKQGYMRIHKAMWQAGLSNW